MRLETKTEIGARFWHVSICLWCIVDLLRYGISARRREPLFQAK